MNEGLAPRIQPILDDLNRPFWTAGADGRLLVIHCRTCRYWIHPPGPVCPRCLGVDIAPEALSGRGVVASFTINHHPWSPALPVPYAIVIVELVEQVGLRLTSNLLRCPPGDVEVGLPVMVEFEQAGDVWVPVFAPEELNA